ncbi:MAG: EAL domain-containing protein [Tepidimonas ignava]|nr:EAL domain-containing protein [Tepidimonas ignava]
MSALESKPTHAAPATEAPAPPHVLVVDDDDHTRAMVAALLRRDGLQVTEATDGEQGVALAHATRPDLILLDVMMPGIDGHATCARIRELLRDDALPIVMLTGADDVASIDAAFQAGATDFITKPIQWTLLRQRVRYALRAGRQARELRRAHLRELAVRRVAGMGYWEWRLDDDTLSWSDEFEPLAGIRATQGVLRETFLQRVHPQDAARLRAGLDDARSGRGRLDLEFRITLQGGERILRVVGQRGQEGADAAYVFGVFHDLTAVRRTEALVDYLSLHDEVTDLPNRRLFLRQVGQALEQGGEGVWVVAADIQRFGRLNATLGEFVANQVLRQLGARLRQLREAGTVLDVARIDGDEFAWAQRVPAGHALEAAIEGVLLALQQPVHLGTGPLQLNLNAGCAAYPVHGQAPEALLTQAQQAQRRARVQGRSWAVADLDELDAQHRQRQLAPEQALQSALNNDEFVLVYQPQLDFASGRIQGCEALLRWHSPTLGVVPPAQFIGLLEESGRIVDVGAWVLREAARQAAAWERAGMPLRVGVNLSARQFMSPRLTADIEAALHASGVTPALLELEITESLTMHDVEHAVALLQRFRALGVSVALDDFGVGHSSLAYVLQFPIDVLKIDRAFVTHVTRGRADRAIVRAIVALAQALGVETIAEGVETQRQCDFLEALGVTQVQGYLIGRPMTAAELEALARRAPGARA